MPNALRSGLLAGGAAGIPPEQPWIVGFLGFKLPEGEELNMSAQGLDDRSGSVQTAYTFVAVGKTGSVVVGKRADRGIAKILVRLPFQIHHAPALHTGHFDRGLPPQPG